MYKFVEKNNRELLNEAREYLLQEYEIGLDFETTGLHVWTHKPLLLILGTNELRYVIDCRSIHKGLITDLMKDLQHKKFVAHNMKFDWRFLYYHYGVELKNIYCTQVISQIVWNGCSTKKNSLAFLMKFFLDKEMEKETRNSFIGKSDNEPFTEQQIDYAQKDVEYLSTLKEKLEELVSKYNMEFLRDLENRFLPVLAKIELEGFKLNVDKWRGNVEVFKQEKEQKIKQLDEELVRLSTIFPNLNQCSFEISVERKVITQMGLFGIDKTISADSKKRIVWSSPKQVGEIFAACGEPVLSTGESELLEYAKANPNTALKTLILLLVGDGDDSTDVVGVRQLEKMITMYGESFLSYINPVTNKIHTQFGQAFTTTGRLSSGDAKLDDGKTKAYYYVNLQNIPADNRLRHCFIAEDGYYLGTADLSGAELRIAASRSQDPLLLGSFNEGTDLHSTLAQTSFRIITGDKDFIVSKKVNEHCRNAHKPIIFGYIYGAGPTRISQVLNIPKEKAIRVAEAIKKVLPKLERTLEDDAKFAVKNYYITGHPRTNRRRWFEDFHKGNAEAYKVEKEAKNMPVQSCNADMVKEAIIEIDEFFSTLPFRAAILSSVHDEVVFTAPIGEEWVGAKVKEIMEEVGNRYLTGVKMESSLNIKPYWEK